MDVLLPLLAVLSFTTLVVSLSAFALVSIVRQWRSRTIQTMELVKHQREVIAQWEGAAKNWEATAKAWETEAREWKRVAMQLIGDQHGTEGIDTTRACATGTEGSE